MTFKIFHIIISCFILLSCSVSTVNNDSVSILELKQQLKTDESILIIDVRTLNEFNGPLGHIPSAKLKPLSEIKNTINEFEKVQNEPIYIICRSGNRSQKATQILKKNGINAINVNGGIYF